MPASLAPGRVCGEGFGASQHKSEVDEEWGREPPLTSAALVPACAPASERDQGSPPGARWRPCWAPCERPTRTGPREAARTRRRRGGRPSQCERGAHALAVGVTRPRGALCEGIFLGWPSRVRQAANPKSTAGFRLTAVHFPEESSQTDPVPRRQRAERFAPLATENSLSRPGCHQADVFRMTGAPEGPESREKAIHIATVRQHVDAAWPGTLEDLNELFVTPSPSWRRADSAPALCGEEVFALDESPNGETVLGGGLTGLSKYEKIRGLETGSFGSIAAVRLKQPDGRSRSCHALSRCCEEASTTGRGLDGQEKTYALKTVRHKIRGISTAEEYLPQPCPARRRGRGARAAPPRPVKPRTTRAHCRADLVLLGRLSLQMSDSAALPRD